MHVHAQAIMRVREEERREWLAEANRQRREIAHTSGGAPVPGGPQAFLAQKLHRVVAMYRSIPNVRLSFTPTKEEYHGPRS